MKKILEIAIDYMKEHEIEMFNYEKEKVGFVTSKDYWSSDMSTYKDVKVYMKGLDLGPLSDYCAGLFEDVLDKSKKKEG